MNKTSKLILGGVAMVAISAGVAGLTAYSMMPEEQSKTMAFDEVLFTVAVNFVKSDQSVSIKSVQ